MKKLYILSVLFLSFNLQAQNVWIVDQNFNAPSGDHVFANFQDAVDAASPGDIIQIQPSPNKYGSATVNKQLTIMGIGFGLTKEIPLTSVITTIVLTNNLTDGTNSSGTVITGLDMDYIYLGTNQGLSGDTLRDVTIHNTQVDYIVGNSNYLPLKNLQIYNTDVISYLSLSNHISGNSVIRNNLFRNNYVIIGSGTPCDLVIANNIIYGYVDISATQSSVAILNNNFIGSTGQYAFNNLIDKTVANNIFYGRAPAAGTAANVRRSIFTNNISISTSRDALPPVGDGTNTGSGNIVGGVVGFVNVPFSNTWSSAHDFTLAVGVSEAINAGSDGTDMGITGGPYAWTESNYSLKTTSAPTIELLNTNTVINPGDNLPVRVKAKSN
jgi:hypothetical protein